jgi:8-oxo-dGTP diphosphatase
VREAAIREAVEEIGIEPELATPIEEFLDDHGAWSYTTLIARATPELVAHEENDESLQVEWIAFDEVTEKDLHPSFAKSWPELQKVLLRLAL